MPADKLYWSRFLELFIKAHFMLPNIRNSPPTSCYLSTEKIIEIDYKLQLLLPNTSSPKSFPNNTNSSYYSQHLLTASSTESHRCKKKVSDRHLEISFLSLPFITFIPSTPYTFFPMPCVSSSYIPLF